MTRSNKMNTILSKIRTFAKAKFRVKRKLYNKASKLEQAYYNTNFLNVIRRYIGVNILKFRYKLRMVNKAPLKLHLGCGDRHFEGYVNIDLRKTRATDLVCDIIKLPYPNDSSEFLEIYHVVEHIPRHDLPKALREWHRILMDKGKLIIECPDFDKAVKEYIEGNEKRIDNIFGLQRFNGDAHYYGYNFKSLAKLLREAGFRDIQNKEPQDPHSKEEPCFRIECAKGDKE